MNLGGLVPLPCTVAEKPLTPSRERAHHVLEAGLPMSMKHPVDALPARVFPSPPLKFRTAGFPQYGFKRDVESDLRHRTTYTRSAERRVGNYCGSRRGLPTFGGPI